MEEYKIDNITEKQLKFGQWLLTHKEKLIKIPIYILLVFCVITVGYSLYGWTIHFLEVGKLSQSFNQMVSLQIDFDSYHSRNRPEPIKFIEPTVIDTGGNKYDIVARVENPNSKWLVKELVYQFQSGEYLTPTTTVYILPKEGRYLMSLGNQSERRLSNLQLKIISYNWQRMKSELELPQINFPTTDVKFYVNDDKSRSWVSFFTTNETIDNFWEVDWQAFLYSGRKLVGINQVRLEQFLSGQTREVTMSWFERLPRVTEVEVMPIVDLLDPDVTYQIPGEAERLY